MSISRRRGKRDARNSANICLTGRNSLMRPTKAALSWRAGNGVQGTLWAFQVIHSTRLAASWAGFPARRMGSTQSFWVTATASNWAE